MKASAEEVGKNKVKLTVEVPSADVDDLLARTYKRLAQEIRVPGFRPGKAPRKVIDQRLGKDTVRSEALKEALPGFYAQAVETSALDVVAPPEIDVKTFEAGQDLTFEATVETRPTPELGDYDGLPGTRPPVEVTDDDVDEQVEQLRVRFATLEVVNRPLQDGDFASVDLTTYHHEETIDELTTRDLLIEVGAEMIVPELDAEIRGKQRGDILKVNATLSERFGERAGLQVGMQVLVKETKARRLPELDDDFAMTVSEFDTLDELREDLRTRIQEMKDGQAQNQARETVLDAFVERVVEVDLPDGMLEMEVDSLLTGLARLLAAQGATLEAYMEAEDLDADALRHRFRDQAERNLKMRLGLDALASAEGLVATDEDRDEHVQRIAERAGRDADEVRRAIDEGADWGSVDGDILRSKALDLLVERANITEEEPE